MNNGNKDFDHFWLVLTFAHCCIAIFIAEGIASMFFGIPSSYDSRIDCGLISNTPFTELLLHPRNVPYLVWGLIYGGVTSPQARIAVALTIILMLILAFPHICGPFGYIGQPIEQYDFDLQKFQFSAIIFGITGLCIRFLINKILSKQKPQ